MRFVWLFFLGLAAAMVVILPRLNRSATPSLAEAQGRASASPGFAERPGEPQASLAALRTIPTAGQAALADSVVAFGLAQRGTPYVYAGTSPLTGFDCSGFIMYTFAHFAVAVPHSTALLIDVGQPVARADAQLGDIVVFTGTAATSTTPGHAGIVVSDRGEVPLRFVHSSSARRESGVKVSHVEGTDYERRFMQVRRVLGVPALAVSKSKIRPAAAAPLPVRSVAVKPAAQPSALPQTLPAKKASVIPPPKKKASTALRKKPSSKPAAKAKRPSSVPRPARPKPRIQPKQPVRPGGLRKAPAAAKRQG